MVSFRRKKTSSAPAPEPPLATSTQPTQTEAPTPPPSHHALVTGGGGFLGRHIVEQLLADGRYRVRVFDIRPAAPDAAHPDVEYVVGDLRKIDDVMTACHAIDIVFHTATAAPTGANAYNRTLMHSVNVDGTNNVIQACKEKSVRALVYTSSASVVFEGKDLIKVNEDTPYAAAPLDFYTATKIEGEKLALQANDARLCTCALRPSGMFGEYDLLTVPTMISKAKAGKMKYIIGKGDNIMDWTYAGNVAAAHLAAGESLLHKGPASSAAGKAYFVTNDDPKPFWGFMGDICGGLGYDRPHIRLPYLLIMFIALFVQYVVKPLLRPIKELETDFTPFRIKVASVNRTFDCSRAKRDFSYHPAVSMDEALERTLKYFDHLKAVKMNGDKKAR